MLSREEMAYQKAHKAIEKGKHFSQKAGYPHQPAMVQSHAKSEQLLALASY